jgi:two-component system chemotaxis response regulator CheB
MLRPGFLHVVRGPKENGHRPAVDALFRTASRAYGPRVIGVVLTGHLDCGTAGLLSIKARGGLAVVQDPNEAAAPNMPQSAISNVAVDHVAPVRELAPLLARLVTEPAAERPAGVPNGLLALEGDAAGEPVEVVCPLCQGALTESSVSGFHVMRCHVGHAFSLDSMQAEQADAVERALWASVRALEESAVLHRRFAERSTGDLRRRFDDKQEVLAQQARVIKQILLSGPSDPPAEALGAGHKPGLGASNVRRAQG